MRDFILWMLPNRFDSVTLLGHIFMRNYNKTVFAHEIVHSKQQKKNPFLFYLRYLFIRKWRFKYEAEAYAASVRNGMPIRSAVRLLANEYRLKGYSMVQCRNEIKYYLSRNNFQWGC